ncbi:hypothetical protein J2W56_000019 [Nocardia kruczakiae]|uniref:Secreted protein n=1 Tax=Nocardia kruczakiae TaxID=261477 RepID=A0ABU1X890_9NOCA|nr:hypothetical protein [Nocardia kruczakiae]MDR7166301.1 hypothetical protein [Nocardia kruczakiae]
MSIPKRSARRLSIVGAVISGLAAVTVSTTVGAGSAQALRPREAFCSSVPVDSRVDIECTNTDVGPATAGIFVLCSDLRPLVQEVRIRPESTIRLSQDCGPGAHPISWNVNAESDHERDRERDAEIDHERLSGHDHI